MLLNPLQRPEALSAVAVGCVLATNGKSRNTDKSPLLVDKCPQVGASFGAGCQGYAWYKPLPTNMSGTLWHRKVQQIYRNVLQSPETTEGMTWQSLGH